MTTTTTALGRATLARQHLLERTDRDPVDVVGGLLALQAQEPAAPYLALHARVDDLDGDAVDAAFADRRLVKATLLRGTLHAVRAQDHALVRRAMEPTLSAMVLRDRRFLDTGVSPAAVADALPGLLDAAAEPRTSAELERHVHGVLGEVEEPGTWWALRRYAPLIHAPRDVPWSFDQRPRFTAPPVVPDLDDPSADDALSEVVVRYLAAHGPATVADVARCCMVTRGRVRTALSLLDGDRVVEVLGPEGAVLLDVPDGPRPDADAPAPPRLLGMWDQLLLAHDDRTRVLPDRFRAAVIRRNGDVLASVLVDGVVAGLWRHRDDAIEVRPLDPDVRWGDDVLVPLAQEAASVLALVAGRDEEVFGRYRRWWDRTDGGPSIRMGP